MIFYDNSAKIVVNYLKRFSHNYNLILQHIFQKVFKNIIVFYQLDTCNLTHVKMCLFIFAKLKVVKNLKYFYNTVISSNLKIKKYSQIKWNKNCKLEWWEEGFKG